MWASKSRGDRLAGTAGGTAHRLRLALVWLLIIRHGRDAAAGAGSGVGGQPTGAPEAVRRRRPRQSWTADDHGRLTVMGGFRCAAL